MGLGTELVSRGGVLYMISKSLEVPDISKMNNKEALEEHYLKLNPNIKKMRVVRIVSQMWDFAKGIKKRGLGRTST